jgi:hypothetical protein
MKKVIMKFVDQEFEDEFVVITYDEANDFIEAMELASLVMYSDFEDYESYEEYKEYYPSVSKKLYDIAMEILDNGNYGVTSGRLCEFLYEAFGWNYEIISEDYIFDSYYGEWK